MKKLTIYFIAILLLASCGNNPKTNAKTAINNVQKEYVEVLYFHGKKRCITCNAIENLTKEVVETDFAEELKNGKIIFKIIDVSLPENEKIADKYEVSWSALFINAYKDGVETPNNMTEFGFAYAKNSPEVFKAGIKEKIGEIVK